MQVLTIHGAKGLDFEHVYLVQLHKASPGDRNVRTEAGRWGDGFEYPPLRRAHPRFRPHRGRASRRRGRRESAPALRGHDPRQGPPRAHRPLAREAESPPLGPGEHHPGAPARPPGPPREPPRPMGRGRRRRRSGGSGAVLVLPGPHRRALEVPLPAAAGRLRHRRRARAPLAAGSRGDRLRLRHPRRRARARRPPDGPPLRRRRLRGGPRPPARAAGRTADEIVERKGRRPAHRAKDRAAAMAAGGAIHRALEEWDLGAAPAKELERQRASSPPTSPPSSKGTSWTARSRWPPPSWRPSPPALSSSACGS